MLQTATNSETGETVVLVDNAWQKAEKTADGPSGEKAYLVGGKWLTGAAAAPQPKPQDRSQFTDRLLNTASGLRYGPMGLIGAGVGDALHGLEQVGKMAGDTVTDTMSAASGKRSMLNPLGMEIRPEVSAAAGTAASLVPGMLAGGMAGRAATPTVMKEGRSWMQSALKPSKLEQQSGEADRAVTTMLEEGVNVTEGGVAKLRDKISTLNGELQTALNLSPATIDKSAIASRLQEVISKIESTTFNPQQRTKDVEKVYNDVLGNVLLPNQIPVALVNKIKQGIYKELGDLKYMRMKSGTPISDAEVSQAALARGAKEEVSAAVPSAAPLNEQMGKLINAADMAENRVMASANRDPGGLAWLTHDLPNFIAMLTARHPGAKSIIARALYSNAESGAPTIGAGVGGSVDSIRQKIDGKK